MPIIDVAKDVAKRVGIDVPAQLAASTDRTMVEMLSVANEMATSIVDAYDWQALSLVYTINGDGLTESHALPADYRRMLKKAQVWSSSLETALTPVHDLNRWLELDIQAFDFVVNAWTIYGGQIHIKPALPIGVTAKFFYQSNLIIAPSSGANKAEFTADTDTFRVSERLLKLGMIWRWKQSKGQPYAEEMSDFEALKERLISDDRGSKMLRVGRVRLPADVSVAYPQAINP